MLLVMRPYQIAATERILNRIVSTNYKKTGTLEAGGYIFIKKNNEIIDVVNFIKL
jgi:type I restriction enzyme R subunit